MNLIESIFIYKLTILGSGVLKEIKCYFAKRLSEEEEQNTQIQSRLNICILNTEVNRLYFNCTKMNVL